ncbi:MAG: Helix-hairpin-helix motif containing protein [Phycisphaerales bacterium]|nr:Helix-hairpin-helix motif containing protein [Phycisphaerales bacterium]
MPKNKTPLRRLLDRIQARFARSRPGSVLVLVVALLVLMALIGTAFITTARTDRFSAQQNALNTEIDLLVQGVVNMAQSVLVDSTYQQAGGPVRPDPAWASVKPTPPVPAAFWNTHWDDPTTDTWMATRIPTLMSEAVGNYVPSRVYNQGEWTHDGGNYYVCRIDGTFNAPPASTPANWLADGNANDNTACWFATSAPLSSASQVEDLRYPAAGLTQPSTPPSDGTRCRYLVRPTSIAMNGINYPALTFYFPGGFGQSDGIRTIPAASATGNGIADSFLWRLPIGEINGVTYYAAVRMIDDNSAVNLNTAYASSYDFDGLGNASPLNALGIFPGNIGLVEMLNTFTDSPMDTGLGTEASNLNLYRFNGQLRPSGVWASTLGAPKGLVLDDTGTPVMNMAYRSVFDAMFMGLGRKMGNPGVGYQTFTWGDSAIIAFRGDQQNSSAGTPSLLEQSLSQSLLNPVTAPGTPWKPNQVVTWFQGYYETTPTVVPGTPSLVNRRPYFVARSPLNNQFPAHVYPVQAAGIMPQYDPSAGTAPRASLNTASFGELWRAFANVVADAPAPTNTPFPGYPQTGAPQLRSSIRDPNGTGAAAKVFFTFDQMQLLRSALAAINTVDLRDSDDNVSWAHVPLKLNINGGQQNVDVVVYGNEKQPFITEVYVNNDTAPPPSQIMTQQGPVADPYASKPANPKGYVAVELYNPYPVDIYLTNYQIGVLNRQLPGGTPPGGYPQAMTMVPLSKFAGFGRNNTTPYIPARGYLILENYSATPAAGDDTAAQYRPLSAFNILTPNFKMPVDADTVSARPRNWPVPGAPPQPGQGLTKYFYVPTLHEILNDPSDNTKPGGEMYLLRTRFPNAQTAPPNDDESKLSNMVPVDNIDLGGVSLPSSALGPFMAWHYVRKNGLNDGSEWSFVYPGRWNQQGAAGTQLRQEGLMPTAPWAYDPSIGTPDRQDPWIMAPPAPAINLGASDPMPSYVNPFPPIQLNNVDFGGPNKLNGAYQFAQFPFGGFARTGDVLQVPFIGAYTVFLNGNLIEMNTITADSALADAQLTTGVTDQQFEQVGRFCPMLASNPLYPGYTAPTATPPNIPTYDPYGWTARVFDYFTAIQSPQDDYLPNINSTTNTFGQWDPNPYFQNDPQSLTWTSNFHNTPVDSKPVSNLAKTPSGGPNKGTENNVPIEGVINLNTASWRVLASVPFYPTDRVQNMKIAQAIVAYRQQNGPYKTLFDLNRVPGFQSIYGDPATSDYDVKSGDISPNFQANPGNGDTDWVRNDFEQRFAAINRVSNLLTTRSDTYTAYILVQGWRGIGTATPELVVQRRAAFIADRSGLTATNKSLNVVNVQAN